MKDWTQQFADEFWLPGEESAARQALFLLQALKIEPHDAVLDCPCGAGRIAVKLSWAGCRVTGVDFKKEFIARARRKARGEGQRIDFRVQDMRKLDFDSEFQAAFNWSGSFGYFDDADNLRVLQGLARAVVPGGRVLVDQPNRQRVLRDFHGRFTRGDIDVTNRWDRHTQRIYGTWRASRAGRQIRSEMSMRLYTPTQMAALIDQAGLKVENLFGDITGQSYRRGSKRLIVVARR